MPLQACHYEQGKANHLKGSIHFEVQAHLVVPDFSKTVLLIRLIRKGLVQRNSTATQKFSSIRGDCRGQGSGIWPVSWL